MWIHIVTTRLLTGTSDVTVDNTPILTGIIDQLSTLINTYMTQAEGFSLDYGSINEYNPENRSYPAVFYEYPEEEDMDAEYDVENRYSEETTLTIRVIAATGTDLEVISDRIIADFNKLFAEFQKTLKVKGLIDYRYTGSVKGKRHVKAYPIEVRTTYLLKYRRIMDDVYTVDSTATAETYTGSAYASPTPVWNTIIANIKTQIDLMTIANGFSYDYGSIDEHDPSLRTYPAVFLLYNEETGYNEEENEIFKYTCSHELTVRVIGETGTDLDKIMLLYRSDFNKMFNDERETFEAIGMDEAEYLGSTANFRHVKAYPIVIDMRYMIHFNRQKKNPYLT